MELVDMLRLERSASCVQVQVLSLVPENKWIKLEITEQISINAATCLERVFAVYSGVAQR